jgi:hypothetical protein
LLRSDGLGVPHAAPCGICDVFERDRHELYLMCDELDATTELRVRGADVRGDVVEERWGRLTSIRLPGGGELGLYEPRHPITPH